MTNFKNTEDTKPNSLKITEQDGKLTVCSLDIELEYDLSHADVRTVVESIPARIREGHVAPSYVRWNGEMLPCYRLNTFGISSIAAWAKDKTVRSAFLDAEVKLAELVNALLSDPEVLKRVKKREANIKVHSICELISEFKEEIETLHNTLNAVKCSGQSSSIEEACNSLDCFEDGIDDLFGEVLELKKLV